jgi:glycosyltransferase involved in cell wall biosynthesis
LPNVKFLGFLDKESQQKAWAECSFAVIPSIVPETFGMIVLEAWARQRPVVAYRIGALAETVDDGINGVLVEPGSPEALAQAIQNLCKDPERIRHMGIAGRDKLNAVYRREAWLQKMDQLYQEVLAHG